MMTYLAFTSSITTTLNRAMQLTGSVRHGLCSRPAKSIGEATRIVRTTALLVFFFASAMVLPAADVRVEHGYPWGKMRLSATSSDKVEIGGLFLTVFAGDVIVDFRFSDGRRVLLATGRLELDPITGDFTATQWPFYHIVQGENTVRHEAANEVDSLQMHGDRMKVVDASKRYIPEPPIMRLRRKQLSTIEGEQ